MKYSIYRRNVHDIPIKTHIELSVVVSGEITIESLDNLLDELYLLENQKRGFQYHPIPTHVSIFLYESKEHVESGHVQWLSMLSRAGLNSKVKKRHQEEYIQNLYAAKEDKFELTEPERKKIWKAVILAERKASQEADDRYPYDLSSSQQTGQSLTIERQTLLIPSSSGSPSSEDPFTINKPMVSLPPGTRLLVLQTQVAQDTNWYLVEARTSEGDFLAKGWISGIALMGQTYMSTSEQLQRNGEINQNLNADALNQIAKLHHLNLDQIYEISVEGLTKKWPFPVHE